MHSCACQGVCADDVLQHGLDESGQKRLQRQQYVLTAIPSSRCRPTSQPDARIPHASNKAKKSKEMQAKKEKL